VGAIGAASGGDHYEPKTEDEACVAGSMMPICGSAEDTGEGQCAFPESGDAYHGKGGGGNNVNFKLRVWCKAWIVCLFGSVNDPIKVSISGHTEYGASEKNALLKSQRGARGRAIANCEIGLNGRAASYTKATYQCVESDSTPVWWN
jgi:hypothetical protein